MIQSKKVLLISSRSFLILSVLSILSVSIMAWVQPQSVMDMVSVALQNNDARSSIRGVYGGVGFSLALAILYLFRNDVQKGLGFLTMFWGFYALSRTITILLDGKLGAFGNKWLVIESLFCFIALILYILNRKTANQSR